MQTLVDTQFARGGQEGPARDPGVDALCVARSKIMTTPLKSLSYFFVLGKTASPACANRLLSARDRTDDEKGLGARHYRLR
jgi:hypothetical protein